MIKNKKEVTLKITPCPDGTWFVQSESTANAFYKTNPTTGHCSCPARKPCKHLSAVSRRFAINGTSLELEEFSKDRYHVFKNSTNRAMGYTAKIGKKFFFFQPSYDSKGYNVTQKVRYESFDFCKLIDLIESEVVANV